MIIIFIFHLKEIRSIKLTGCWLLTRRQVPIVVDIVLIHDIDTLCDAMIYNVPILFLHIYDLCNYFVQNDGCKNNQLGNH